MTNDGCYLWVSVIRKFNSKIKEKIEALIKD